MLLSALISNPVFFAAIRNSKLHPDVHPDDIDAYLSPLFQAHGDGETMH
jgi:hypothetical protein